MNSGLYALPGVSATVCAAASGSRLELAETNASNVNLGSRRALCDSLVSRTAVRTVAWVAGDGAGTSSGGVLDGFRGHDDEVDRHGVADHGGQRVLDELQIALRDPVLLDSVRNFEHQDIPSKIHRLQ